MVARFPSEMLAGTTWGASTPNLACFSLLSEVSHQYIFSAISNVEPWWPLDSTFQLAAHPSRLKTPLTKDYEMDGWSSAARLRHTCLLHHLGAVEFAINNTISSIQSKCC